MTSTGESNLNLTREQLEILEFVRKGHILVITGQAGVGKSRVVRAIREDRFAACLFRRSSKR